MGATSTVQDELRILRAQLAASPRPASGGPSVPEMQVDAGEPDGETDFDRQLRELGRMMAELTENAEDVVADHPLASVVAAFVLGVAVGRLAGRG
jgi:hypothetical protein